ncbi:chondroitin AC/alginate lyase [Choiromyces venosus 120613-1]|uniref:Chondroitin AC/alginate lyase n=1 Tax=Choiromyces venosus 120613-1 TaxID=1336337 RepID=A0A3N4JBD8_9PEZI|nr:chondroitin AC/alginate lyase [Choiromyces venosus 120613-1]
MWYSLLLYASAFSPLATALVHPGLLHSATDFTRVASKVATQTNPWYAGYQKLIANSHAQTTWVAAPVPIVYRGVNPNGQNYGRLYNDIAAAYALALRWKITDDAQYAKASAAIVDAWSSTLTEIGGSADRFLAAGLYGYQMANVVEILRAYPAWTGFTAAKNMLVNIFYPMSHHFLVNHNDAAINHYWSNWDLCNLNNILAVGVVADNQTMFNEAINYFYNGGGNGAITKAIWKIYTNVEGEDLGQLQESGRDQGHTMLALGMLATFAQMANNQGVNLFEYLDNRILKGSEYAAKFNLGYDVPYTTYVNRDVTQTVISNASRGDIRPIWELLYNHYGKAMGKSVKYTRLYTEKVRAVSGGAEGGGGDYGPNSGGYDQLGYGTLMYSV